MLPDEELGALRERIRRFASEARVQSPLYERLSLAAAENDVAVQILASAPDERQRRANLLFAAVHDVLLTGVDHPLAAYYPSVGGDRSPDAGAEEAFIGLLRQHRAAVEARVRGRATQTNEVGRCAALWPALRMVAGVIDAPMVLVELGSSAGLLLHLDRFRYDLDGWVSGEVGSAVGIAPEIRGGATPRGLEPDIVGRLAIDLSPLDPADPDDARWLQACVWPENVGRLQRLRAALDVARRHADVEVATGDIIETLPRVLAELDNDVVPVVLHSAALAYLDADGRQGVEDALEDAAASRVLARISLEGQFLEPFATLDRGTWHASDEPAFTIGLTTWAGGERHDMLLGRSHPHGHWIQWAVDDAGRENKAERVVPVETGTDTC